MSKNCASVNCPGTSACEPTPAAAPNAEPPPGAAGEATAELLAAPVEPNVPSPAEGAAAKAPKPVATDPGDTAGLAKVPNAPADEALATDDEALATDDDALAKVPNPDVDADDEDDAADDPFNPKPAKDGVPDDDAPALPAAEPKRDFCAAGLFAAPAAAPRLNVLFNVAGPSALDAEGDAAAFAWFQTSIQSYLYLCLSCSITFLYAACCALF